MRQAIDLNDRKFDKEIIMALRKANFDYWLLLVEIGEARPDHDIIEDFLENV